MTLTLPLATDNATTQQQQQQTTPPAPRLSHDDADYTRLHSETVRRLTRSVRLLVRDLRRASSDDGARQHAATSFIHRHHDLLAAAYEEAHAEGLRDYWAGVSLTRRGHPMPPPSTERVKQRLAYYAVVSCAKMAHEALTAQRRQPQPPTVTLDEFDLIDWEDSLGARLNLQAEITWSGLNDGATDGGMADPANPFAALWWVLGAVKTDHCSDCPLYAAGSPYDPPWTGGGVGGNQLNATPGDGHTDCGAACKCALTFETPDSATQWNALYEGLASLYESDPTAFAGFLEQTLAAGVSEGEPLLSDEGVPSQSVLLDSQKQALDLYRATVLAWGEWRGALPPMPDLLGDSGDFFAALPAWDQLTPKQQGLFDQALEAVLAWGEATRNFLAGTGDETFSNETFADSYDRGMVLYNHNHDKGGRFAPGRESLPGEHEGEGASGGGGVHGAGNRMVAQAHHAGSGGGGGGNSSSRAGNTHQIARAEQAVHLAHSAHMQREHERLQAEAARTAALVHVQAMVALHPVGHPTREAAVDAFRDSGTALHHAHDQVAFAQRRVQAAEARLDILHGGTGIRVAYHDFALRTGQDAVHTVFGRHLDDKEIVAMAGARAGDRVDVHASHAGFRVEVNGPHLERRFEVYFDHATGEIVLHDGITRNLDPHDATSGQHLINGMHTMDRLGIMRIETVAARGDTFNGYNTWPKVGFDGPIPRTVRGAARTQFGSRVKLVSDIRSAPGGKAWWKQNGDTFDATFSFHQGSESRRQFERYLHILEQRPHKQEGP